MQENPALCQNGVLRNPALENPTLCQNGIVLKNPALCQNGMLKNSTIYKPLKLLQISKMRHLMHS